MAGRKVGSGHGIHGMPRYFRRALLLELGCDEGGPFVTSEMREIARVLINLARAADLGAIRELAERIEGKSVQGVELTGAGENGAIDIIGRIVLVRPDPRDMPALERSLVTVEYNAGT